MRHILECIMQSKYIYYNSNNNLCVFWIGWLTVQLKVAWLAIMSLHKVVTCQTAF